MDFTDAADELYGVAPAEFVAARRRLAGDLPREDARRLTALRRPTVSAWAVNLLVRDGAVGELLDLGERMRAAWSSGGDLGDLERERGSMIDDLVVRARTLAAGAGRPLTGAFATEVEDTLRAAVADPEAAGTVRAGRLDHPMRHTGFGTFGGVAAPKARRPARQDRRAEQAREAARALAELTDALKTAKERLSDADERLGRLRAQVEAMEQDRARLDGEAQVAEREYERAKRADEEARRRMDSA